jgi:hypothetical protein
MDLFGTGHWPNELAQRWQQAHGQRTVSEGLNDLPRQWFSSTGFGTIAGADSQDIQANDIAQFSSENGVPLFWMITLISTFILWHTKPARRLVGAMLIMLACQLLFWLVGTHHQSRFLIPTLLPACILAGMGFDRIRIQSQKQYAWLFPIVSVGVMLLLTVTCFNVFLASTQIGYSRTESGQTIEIKLPPFILVDSLIDPSDVTTNQPGRFAGRHAINQLPKNARVLMISHGGQLVYINRNITYNSAFDASLLGQLIEQHKENPVQITLDLIKQGYTHIWFDRGEYRRLANSYGFDSRITESFLDEKLFQLWRPMRINSNSQHLFQLGLKLKRKPKPEPESESESESGSNTTTETETKTRPQAQPQPAN